MLAGLNPPQAVWGEWKQGGLSVGVRVFNPIYWLQGD